VVVVVLVVLVLEVGAACPPSALSHLCSPPTPCSPSFDILLASVDLLLCLQIAIKLDSFVTAHATTQYICARTSSVTAPHH
jgi:hypothetical protein